MKFFRCAGITSLLFSALLTNGAVAATDVTRNAPDTAARKFDEKQLTRHSSNWKGGSYIELCRDGAARVCSRLKIPKAVGRVQKVVPGPIIASARASWLVASRFETFVCAALLSRATVACTKVQGSPLPLAHADLSFLVTADNRTRIAIIPSNKKVDHIRLAEQTRDFQASFWRAARVLQGEIDGVNARAASAVAGTLSVCDTSSDPGPAPHPECTLVEEGGVQMWSCPIPGDPPADPEPQPEPEWPEWPEPEWPECP